MDPSNSANDVIRCDHCKDAYVQKYCDVCHVNMCISCVGKHISDDYDKYKVVPFQKKKSTLIYPKCPTYPTESCEIYCKDCKISVCSLCTTMSDTHKGHAISTLSDVCSSKKDDMAKDTGELEMMDVPKLITTINTRYKYLRSVNCNGDKEIWTCAYDIRELKCFCIHGSVIKTIKTKSVPYDIAFSRNGDLLYSGGKAKTVNKVKNGQIEEIIQFQGWKPSSLCVTCSDDLLVTMSSDDETQCKVVRYSGSTEKQTIQLDDEGKPLYSGRYKVKYITENRNLDICVADWEAEVVVVVNQFGKLRFRYTGHTSSTKDKPFQPQGIATDSLSQILTADLSNHCIHILDRDGQFLCFIDNCDLKTPCGIFVDKNDMLFVAEYDSGSIKKIQYLK